MNYLHLCIFLKVDFSTVFMQGKLALGLLDCE